MVAVVAVETVLLVLLLVLVAGLLRSHAEILRRLGSPPEMPAASGAVPARPRATPARAREPAPPLTGTTPGGGAVSLSFHAPGAAPTLLAFLTTGCSTCAAFWSSLAQPRLPDGVDTVIVTRGAERERPAGVAALAPAAIEVVMSSAAWEDYDVPGAPYFVLVHGSVLGEGVATTWHALASLVGDALEEAAFAAGPGGAAGPARAAGAARFAGADRGRELDAVLAAGGIDPAHPSLYPAGKPAGRP